MSGAVTGAVSGAQLGAVTRRRLIGLAAGAAPLAALGVSLAPAARAAPLLVHDASLPAGRRFAAHAGGLGMTCLPLQGDRVRLIRRLLADGPAAVFGVTRHADHLLFAEIAREAGYRDRALLQHRRERSHMVRAQVAVANLAEAAGPCWPEAFAELALGTSAQVPAAGSRPRLDAAFSWIFERGG